MTRIEAVKGISNQATPGVYVANFATATLAGELIVIGVQCGQSGGLPATITDNLGQAYTLVKSKTGLQGGHYAFAMYYKENSAAGVTSITVTDAAGDRFGSINAAHYTGMATAASLDQSDVTGTGQSSPWVSPDITPTMGGTLGLALCYARPTAGTAAIAGTNGWTEIIKSAQADGAGFDGNNQGALGLYEKTLVDTSTIHASGTDGATTPLDYIVIANFKPLAVPQKQRPYQDSGVGNWTKQDGTLPISPAIGETVEDDATYARSGLSPIAADISHVKLTAANDPVSNAGHKITVVYGKDVTGGDRIDLTIRLMQYAPGNGARFEILNKAYANIDAKTTDVINLTGAQADAIVDYGDLWLDFEAIKV